MPGSSTHDRDSGHKADRSITGVAQAGESRGERRRRRNRQALIEAGYQIMAQKGIDAATMAEITELADVGGRHGVQLFCVQRRTGDVHHGTGHGPPVTAH
jgi:hypothetical protein